jgi:ComF family protein
LAKQLIYELKFGRNQAAAPTIAELLSDSLPYLPQDTFIVHIPTSTVHVRRRGYDQAELIADHLARRVQRRHFTLLARQGQQQQVGSKRQTRLTQLRGAFRPRQISLIQGATILLVDDVLTTGATIEEAARILKQAGAKRVNAAVFARAQ